MAIRVTISEGNALVWNAEDARVLREDHRIVGCLVGSHPRTPYQNTQLSLPLLLMPEEVSLLYERGIVTLIDGNFDDDSSGDDDDDELSASLKRYQDYMNDQFQEQNDVFEREQIANQEKFRDDIEKGDEKRRERAMVKGEDPNKSTSTKSLTKDYMMIQLFNEEPWILREKVASWHYPRTRQEWIRYCVFRDLWQKGYYLTSGSKFGGDFLVYPGDPMMFHSFHVAVCLEDECRLSVEQLVSMGRLGSNVRKTSVICSVSEEDLRRAESSTESGTSLQDIQVHYLTLEWTGFS